MAQLLSILNYGMVLLFGIFLSVQFAGVNKSKRTCIAIVCFSGFTLCVQTVFAYLFGLRITTKLYPLIVHLILVLFLVFILKKPVRISLVSVLTAYFCCQLPRWIGVLTQQLFHNAILSQLIYSGAIIGFYLLLRHFFVEAANQAMTYSKQSLILFGSLPAVYYVFDYATTVYTDILYTGIKMMSEFLPTLMALFYVWFIVAYHSEVQQKTQIQIEKNVLNLQMEAAKGQLELLRSYQEQTVIYRHDMRHHFAMIDSFAQQGELAQITEYLANAQQELIRITPLRFCENETVNLLLSSFMSKAQKQRILLSVHADLPRELNISDTELCSVLSNGLENAFHAVSKFEDHTMRKVAIDCRISRNMLLIEIANAYIGTIKRNGETPTSTELGHGYGCKSMRSIAEKRNGFCTFEEVDGVFTLRVVLPIKSEVVV